MSDSYSAEQELRNLAIKLHEEAYLLERAADTMQTLRESRNYEEPVKRAKEWAKSFLQK